MIPYFETWDGSLILLLCAVGILLFLVRISGFEIVSLYSLSGVVLFISFNMSLQSMDPFKRIPHTYENILEY